MDSTIGQAAPNEADRTQMTDDALKAMMVLYTTILLIFLVYLVTLFYYPTERLVRERICDRTLLCDKRDK